MHANANSVTPRGTPSRRGRSPRFSTDSPSQPGPSSAFADNNGSNKLPTSFVSSLSIRVEGAQPIITPEQNDTTNLPQAASAQESKRAPRKSKTDALAALNSHARANSPSPGDEDPLLDYYHNARPIPVSPKLDLSSVKTSSPRNMPPRTSPRPFDLEDCPEFFPTTEEFRDPMAYIKSISDKGKKYGICKIIPPEGWKMPFVTDTEIFRFKTRLQRLNSIEASSRAKLNFLEQLYRFHKQQGNPRVVVPTINHKPLDLWLLRKEVHKLGGYDAVTKGKKWSELGAILGYRGVPGLSTQIKNSYTRVILPYEHFCERAKNQPISPMAPHRLFNDAASSRMSNSVESPPSSPLTATSSPLSEPPDENDLRDSKSANGRPRRSTRVGSQECTTPASKKPASSSSLLPSALPVFYESNRPKEPSEQHCEICHKKNRGEEMLLCDGCDCGFHMFCLDPPLDTIPKDQWFCYTCLFGTGGDFGFDEGEEHSLSSFQARDLAFRRMWFEQHPPERDEMVDANDPTVNRFGNVVATENDVEREFWRLVQSTTETVEIEYGADVHSTTHGSAMPTMETHPLNTYSKDPWNLNNIPIVSDSLLRFIKSDISGMTVPWTYVGMAFSTFCWHNEDHYTYSINFMHWGETKTWYGIPGEDAEKFEAAIKSEAPDLFEAQPDLLFQLVTLMNPKRVKDANVRVYACNQRAGEFVITFPKAYHAGFNHGLNFNEAVNFALPDWLPFGRECVQRYREHAKLPVFSHDELLITITQQSESIKTAMWLIDSLNEMIDREMADRRRARARNFGESLEEEDRPEDQYQCAVCKMFCYLSQVTCPCTTKVVCVEHADLLCERGTHHVILRKRFSDPDLLAIQTKVAERAKIPAAWRVKLTKLLTENACPPLRSLRALLSEGDRINIYLPEIASLRKCVNRANEWVEAASAMLAKKPRKRSRKSRTGRPSEAGLPKDDDATMDKLEYTIGDFDSLLDEVLNLGFDCPEIATLRSMQAQADRLSRKAAYLVNINKSADRGGLNQEEFLAQCKDVLLEGTSFNVVLPMMVEVERIVNREQLAQELQDKVDDQHETMSMEEVRHLIARAESCSLPTDNSTMSLLISRERAGNLWEDRAKALLAQPIKTVEELERLAAPDDMVPLNPPILDRLKAARAKALDYEKQANAWLKPEPDAPRPRVQDVMRLVDRAEKDFSIPAINDLKRTVEIAMDLEARCEQVLKGKYLPREKEESRRGELTVEKEDVFEAISQWQTYAREHLSMFILPYCDKLEAQLKYHHKWIRDLPWFCDEHAEAHGLKILDDVISSTRPEDDLPPSDEYFTCICTEPVRPPPPGVVSDAVQCDHCFARFHGVCAKNGGSCPFCDHTHWNGTIHKERSWHFCYLPPALINAPEITKNYSEEWKQLEIIVHRIDRLSAVIGQFLAFTSQLTNQRPEYIHQVRHYMRKLFRIQFAVSPNSDVSFGLDLAGLHRILAGRPALARAKKRRRPRFTFGQDIDKDWADGTRCICRGRTPYLLNYPTVECESCNKFYHAGCVFFPFDPTSPNKKFACPLCCLRKNRTYLYSEVRVKPSLDTMPLSSDTYVNTKEMLDSFSKDVIYKKMPPPYTQTLFVELVRFVPGQPEFSPPSGPAPRPSIPPIPQGNPMPHIPSPHDKHTPMQLPAPSASFSPPSMVSQHVPPPPPWSRWGTVTTPSRPPSTQRRHAPDTPRDTPQPSRKRKLTDEPRPPEEPVNGSSSKRRVMDHGLPQPQLAQPRNVQTLSPSLALIVSPIETPPTMYSNSPPELTDDDIHHRSVSNMPGRRRTSDVSSPIAKPPSSGGSAKPWRPF
ncbi:[histone H3]-trimethyl-L-lysine(4) demethylase [Pleurotus pulmonarius]